MSLYSLVSQIPPIVFSIAVAAIICFLGYQLHKAGILLVGAGMGYTLGRDFTLQFFDQNTAGIVALITAVVVAALCLFLYKVGSFVFCGAVAALFLSALVSYFPVPAWVQALILIAGFLIAGGLSFKFLRPVIIVITGLLGGINLLSCLLLMGLPIPAGLWQVLTMLALSGLGIFFQLTTTK